MRVMAVSWWYTDGRQGHFEAPTDDELMAEWEKLPDDGVLAFKFYYDVCSPTRLAQNLNGNDWYWLQPTDKGVLFGHSDDTQENILARYPGAVLRRGQWTTPDEMQRVITEQSAATYWADAPIDTSLAGCCGN